MQFYLNCNLQYVLLIPLAGRTAVCYYPSYNCRKWEVSGISWTSMARCVCWSSAVPLTALPGTRPWLSLPMAMVAPTLQPQHPASTTGTPGLLRASPRSGPAALHSSRVGPWGAAITSCQQPRGALHPRSSQCTGTCPGLARAPGSALRTAWFCSQCWPLLLHTPARGEGCTSSPEHLYLCGHAGEQGPRGAQTASHPPHLESGTEANNKII